jgi:hypothetical protein
VPAITHVDGTARLQTVGADDDPLLRRLLTGFDARTGVPVLLNTSFNGKDEPIVETPQEALATFRRMPMHALAMPPFLSRKRMSRSCRHDTRLSSGASVLPGATLTLHVATDSRAFACTSTAGATARSRDAHGLAARPAPSDGASD